MRPGSDYQHSLNLLKRFKKYCPDIKTKCGLMVGLGEIEAEVIALLNDLKDHDVDLITVGQYLQPSKSHALFIVLFIYKNLKDTLSMESV